MIPPPLFCGIVIILFVKWGTYFFGIIFLYHHTSLSVHSVPHPSFLAYTPLFWHTKVHPPFSASNQTPKKSGVLQKMTLKFMIFLVEIIIYILLFVFLIMMYYLICCMLCYFVVLCVYCVYIVLYNFLIVCMCVYVCVCCYFVI